MFQGRAGLPSLLKEGNRHFSGLEEAVFRNISACDALAQITQTSMGPNAMNKLISNHFEKLYTTSDGATILSQLEVQHPAAKVICEGAKMQEQEFGDGTNAVVVLAGSLLRQAESLLKEGLHVSEIIKGYELALEKSLKIMPECAAWKVSNVRSVEELTKAVTASVSSKAGGCAERLASLVAEAAVSIMPPNAASFDLDNVRVAKLGGGSLNSDSALVNGMVCLRDTSGTVKAKQNCNVMVLGCGLEAAMTETKGTVLLKSADELFNYTKLEEDRMDASIKSIKDAGVDAIFVGGSISDIALHYCNKYQILVLKCLSKFDLRRLCRTVGAPALIKIKTPTPDEMGKAESIEVTEIASKKVTIVKGKDTRVSTILLRSATPNALDEAERTIDDGLHTVKALISDPRFVAGAGATEMELATHLKLCASKLSASAAQTAVVFEAFAMALESVPHTLAANSGLPATEVVTRLYALHQLEGKKSWGVDVLGTSSEDTGVADVVSLSPPVLDHLQTRLWAFRFAVEAAVTVLRVDQIIMSKPAGGPRPPKAGHWDDDDE